MDDLTKQALLLILDSVTFDRSAVLKVRELRRRIESLDKTVDKPDGLQPLCPL